ncbi:NAD-dependent epimerase/dehydratase family protein [Pseudonocardia sp.]|uniref:NAD-dependent epimerase/dehydratase family protein n=1 Tax=Pseudonocardia sp. TaxID=60912 RepID=UPI003D0CE4D0
MRALVTGGAGFIGSHLVDSLVTDGADVCVVDDMSHGSEANLAAALDAGAQLAKVDIREAGAVAEVFARFRPEVVFHLAAQIDVRTSMVEPARDAEINVLGSLNVFTSAKNTDVRRVVNTSTGGAIYGEPAVVPTPETAPARPLSGYGLGKRTTEEYGRWFGEAHGLDVVSLRYGNVYGPRQDPTGDAGVIGIFCNRVLTGARPVVFGDGRQTRDYVYVGDIVRANRAAAAAEGLRHSRYNVGTGVEVSVLDLVAAVAAAAGIDAAAFAPELRPARHGEVLRSCLDVTRAREDLGLTDPTPLAEGLLATLDWVRGVTPDAVR